MENFFERDALKSMVYVTGDMHGIQERFAAPALRKLKKSDFLLVCGDFGFIWDGGKDEASFLKKIGNKKYTVAFVDGSHENFDLLDKYPLEEWGGAQARHINGNLWHLVRGQVYDLGGERVFAMGGGENTDFDTQTSSSNEWTGREMPTDDELRFGAANLKAAGNAVEYIVTHEPPMKLKEFLGLRQKGETRVTGLNTYLEELSHAVTFTRWFFGSLHLDKHVSGTYAAVFQNVVNAKTGRTL
ncbi:MAG: metallophosphoesterase [Oscillospiraceae bacterium]|nr:metallophosphoesterase [Oscillospiraceae bacterium]